MRSYTRRPRLLSRARYKERLFNGWVQNYGVYVADHTVNLTLSFIYIKDPLKDDGTDTASIRNITITDVTKSETAIDFRCVRRLSVR